MTNRIVRHGLFTILVLLAGCGGENGDPPGDARQRPRVVHVVNPFLEDVATELAGNVVEVVNPIPPDVDATDWQPSDDDVRTMQGTGAILLNGAHFSKWTERVSLPDDRLVDTSRGFTDRYVRVEDFSVHTHGAEGEHSHPGTAPNTYLDPALAIEQTKAVRDALVDLAPDERESIEDRYEALAERLRAIDADYTAATKEAKSLPVFASHPFCSYLGKRASWEIVHLHWQPDEMPTDAQWTRFEERLGERPTRWMLWNREPLPQIAKRLQELGVSSVVVDSGVRRIERRDVFDVLRANLEVVRRLTSE